jgi:hypothetical protein
VQSRIPDPEVQQFIFDCAELASRLDSLDIRSHRVHLNAALLSGRAQYDALLLRRQVLCPSIDQEGWIGFMLDGLRARLKFLEGRVGMNENGGREPPS